MQKQFLNPISLNFRSSSIQSDYEYEHNLLKKNQCCTAVVFQIIVSLLLAIRNLTLKNIDWQNFALFFALTIILLVGLLKISQYKFTKEVISLITIGTWTYVVAQQYVAIKPDCSQLYKNLPGYVSVATGAFFHLLSCIMCSSMMKSWLIRTGSIILSTEVLFYFLLYQLEAHLIIYHIILFLWVFYFYFEEKSAKIFFYQQYIQKVKLKDWKTLLQTIIPSSIFIAQVSQDLPGSDSVTYELKQKKVKVIFANSYILTSLANMQQCEDEKTNFEIIEDQLNQIMIADSHNSGSTSASSHKLSMASYLGIFFHDKNSSIISQRPSLDYFLTKNAAIKVCGSLDTAQKIKHFDITLVECIWQDEHAVMCVLNEITDKIKQQTQLQELNQYKDLLLANVSHDLKTPLSAITSYSNLAIGKLQLHNQQHAAKSATSVIGQSVQAIDESIENLFVIKRNAVLLQHLIMDILDYTQINQGQLRLKKTYFTLKEVTAELKQLFSHQIQYKGLYLKFSEQFEAELDQIYTDRNRLLQILINLISNAIKYTFQGGIVVKFAYQLSKPDILRITVSDTGVGIPKEVQNRLFSQFQSFDHYQNCNQQGIGLGLSICKKLCEQLGPIGELLVQSEVADGSQFTLEIYIKQQAAPGGDRELLSLPKQPFYEITQFTSHSLENINIDMNKQFNILIVDDSIYHVMSLEFMLQSLLCNRGRIFKSYSGIQAIDVIKEKFTESKLVFSLIFIDLDMPIIGGIETLSRICKLFSEEFAISPKLTKFVMCSTFGQQAREQCAAGQYHCEYLDKPININKLIQIVNS